MSLPAAKPVVRPTNVRYAVLALLCSLAFLTYLDRICIMRVQGEVVRDLGLDQLTDDDEARLAAEGKSDDPDARRQLAAARAKERMAWVFSAFTLGYLLFEIPGGWLGDRWGARRVIIRIVLWWSAFTALTGSADRLAAALVADPSPLVLMAALVAVRFLFGAGEAGAYPNVGRAIARWFPFRDRGYAQGWVWLSSRLGGALAPTVLGTLMAFAGGWRQGFWALGLVGAAWAVAFAWWFRDTPEQVPAVNDAERDLIRAGAIPDQGHVNVPWSRLLGSVSLWALALTASCVSFNWYFYITFLPKYLEEHFRVSFTDSQLTSGMPLLVGGVACLLGGRLSDLLIRRTGSRRWGRSLVGLAAFGSAGLVILLVPLAGSGAQVIVLLCVANFCQDLAVPVIWTVAADIGGRYTGTASGFMNMVGGVGAVLSPIVVARFEPRFGWNAVFLLFAAVYLVGAVLWLAINAARPLEPAIER